MIDKGNYYQWYKKGYQEHDCRAWKEGCVCETLCTKGGTKVAIESKSKVLGNYSPSNHNAARIVDKNCSAPTVMENHGTITATQTNDLRIRKLTPKECFRLQGVKDSDTNNIMKNQSNASAYHLAGDSIVTLCLMAIIGNMCGIDYKDYFRPDEWWNNN